MCADYEANKQERERLPTEIRQWSTLVTDADKGNEVGSIARSFLFAETIISFNVLS